MNVSCEFLTVRDGHTVPVFCIDGRRRTLGSCYDGSHAAKVWLNQFDTGQTENMILFGMGDGEIAEEARRRFPGEIMVYEPCRRLYDYVIHTEYGKKVVESGVRVFCEQPDKMETAITQLLNEDAVETTLLAVHPGYMELFQDEWMRLCGVCENLCNQIGFMKKPIQRFIGAMTENQIKNIEYMEKGIPVARLKKYWKKDMPVIMVAAGPSLEKNKLYLKQAVGKTFIFCVDAALPALLREDIVPDLLACTDAMKNMNCFEDERSKDIPLLVTTNSPSPLLEESRSYKVWGNDHEYISDIMAKVGIELPRIPFYSGVATALLATILELGTQKIIFVGQDLAYSPDGRSHISGREEEYVRDEAYKIEGYDGGMVYSRGDWVNFLEWFEDTIQVFPQCKFINATEGGAKIHGAEQMTLFDVIAGLENQKDSSLTELLRDERVALTSGEYDEILCRRDQGLKELHQIAKQGYDKTFFGMNFRQVPVMHLVIDYMKSLEDDSRKVRFEKSVSAVLEKMRKIVKDGGKYVS